MHLYHHNFVFQKKFPNARVCTTRIRPLYFEHRRRSETTSKQVQRTALLYRKDLAGKMLPKGNEFHEEDDLHKYTVFNSKKSEGQITLKGRKEGSIYQRKRDRRRREEERKGGREKA